jgi:hypothetical protein
MKRHLFRLVITMLALGSGTAFASTPGTSGHVTQTKPMPIEAAMNSHETPPQKAGDESLIGMLGLVGLGVSGALVQLRRPRH